MLEESWSLSNKATSSQGAETQASYYCLLRKEHDSSSSSSFLSDSSRFIYFVNFLSETWLSVRQRTACLLISYTRFQIRNTAYRSGFIYTPQASMIFVLSKQEEHMSYRSVVPKDQNKLCAHDKNRRRAELWVKICNVCIRFDTWKIRRMKQSRSLAVLFDKPGRIERQADPNTDLPNLIDSHIVLYVCRI